MLPANIRSAGELTVASSIGYPPYEFYASDGKTFEGIDIDLINAVGKALGVKVKITDTRYPNITPALQAHRFDLAISAIPDDQAGPFVSLVNYLDDASGGYIVGASNKSITTKDPTSMCGATVGIVQGETTELPFLNAISKSCKSAGKSGISTKIYAQTATILLGIESGQVTARGASVSQGEFDSKQAPTKLKFVPDVIPAEAAVKDPTGIAIPKNSTQLIAAVEAAMNELHSDGTYQAIFKKWGVTATEIPVSVTK
jgi:polar amino acid transport system substrate-binding protein